MAFSLSLGERGTRKAGGEGSLPEVSNLYCHPGRAGGSPIGLGYELMLVPRLLSLAFGDGPSAPRPCFGGSAHELLPLAS